ncbi:MAG: pyridoxal-phosphate dependent enzyme [Chloroflexota bacterium]|nr:pyridoxal-phosphate dependent enzyme [Chloroflexota bacterium]
MTAATGLECLRCGTGYPPEEIVTGCPRCREQGYAVNLRPSYSQEAFRTVREGRGFDPEERGVWRYHALLPVGLEHAVWLGEGETPLVHATTLGAQVGLDFLYLKNEARNPTGSFKDRLAAVVVARAKAAGARTVALASSGNAGAAVAAYAAVAGLRCVVFTTASAPLAMKAQMLAYGARLFATPTGPDRWTLLGQAVETYGWYCASNYVQPPVGSNPYGVEGYKTIAFEVWEQMGREAPDVMAFPVAYGDELAGTMRGFGELAELGFIGRAPRPVAGEVFGPLSRAQAESLEAPAPVETAPTVAISIGGGQSTFQALNALYENDGRAQTVEDAELLAWQAELARTEGIYAEASSLASVAALARLRKDERLRRGAVAVALTTATGLKDPGAGGVADNVPVIQPTLADLERAMRETYGAEPGAL